MFKVSLIIPTYNEAKNIPLFIEEVWSIIDKRNIDLEFIIVDDNSPDGTGDIAQALAKQYPVRVVRRAGKLGLGSAVIEGFKRSDRPYIGVMDADLSHDPAILNDLIMSLDDYDIALGSRFEKTSVIEDWKWWRKLISNVGVWFARRLTGVKDPLSGYFFMRRGVVTGVPLTTIGYKILMEILVKGQYRDVRELPYQFRMRLHSSSKLNYREYLLFIKQLIAYTLYKLRKGT